jgi:hypothetical protein
MNREVRMFPDGSSANGNSTINMDHNSEIPCRNAIENDSIDSITDVSQSCQELTVSENQRYN